MLVRGLHDGHHVLFAGGINYQVRRKIHLPAAEPEQITEGLAGRMHQTILFGGG